MDLPDQHGVSEKAETPPAVAVRALPVAAPGGAGRLAVAVPILIIVGGLLIVAVGWAVPSDQPILYFGAMATIPLLFAFIAATILKNALAPYERFETLAAASVEDAVTAGKRYELALRGASVGFWDWDFATGTIFYSDHLMAMLGYANKDHVDTIDALYASIHPNDIEGVKRTMEFHLDRRTPDYFVEYRVRKQNGEYIWVEDRGKATFGTDGKPARAAGVMKEITNEKRVQSVLESRTNELEEAKVKIEAEIRNVHKFQMAVDSSTEAISITTPEGAIVYVNPAWVELNGWTEAEAMGRTERELLFSDETGGETIATMSEKLSAGLPFASEDVVQKRKDGTTYHVALSVFPLRENGMNIFLVSLAEDITRRKEVDKAKTEFVSLASHQLRTPLSAIRWYSEMLLSKYAGELNPKQRQYVEEIYHGNLRMVELVNALLNTSRIDLGTFAMEPEDVDPVEIAGSVIAELRPETEKRKQHIAGFFSHAPKVYRADPKLLRVIIQNFLSNSVKYTPDGGTIEIEIAAKDAFFYLRVSDTGYGIPKGQESQIFKKLFRADNVRQRDTEGTGLGLYIVKAVVEASGGSISFDTEENKGTTFHVYLPISGMPRKTGTKGLS